jgi:hypothetical protein
MPAPASGSPDRSRRRARPVTGRPLAPGRHVVVDVSLADLVFSGLLLSGLCAEALDLRARRRARRGAVPRAVVDPGEEPARRDLPVAPEVGAWR